MLKKRLKIMYHKSKNFHVEKQKNTKCLLKIFTRQIQYICTSVVQILYICIVQEARKKRYYFSKKSLAVNYWLEKTWSHFLKYLYKTRFLLFKVLF